MWLAGIGITTPEQLKQRDSFEVYAQLKAAAELHRRSLNNEAIACLEDVLLPRKVSASERVLRARVLRAPLPTGVFVAAEIDAAKRQGRK